MNDYSFEKYIGVGAKGGETSITFSGKYSQFSFNSGFYTSANIKNFKSVILFFDNNKKAVAFKFLSDAQSGAFTIAHSKSGNAGYITAKSFCVKNNLVDEQYTGRKKPIKIQDEEFGELWVINLL